MSPSRFHSTLTDAYGRKLRNRPYNIQDLADQAENYAQDIPQMAYQPDGITDPQDANGTINSANNFSYDALGQRTKDEKADIELIEWTASGKMKRIQRTAASGKPDITFAYDGAGNRILKQVGDPDVDPAGYREHYVLDAQGNIMAVYRYTNNGPKSLKVVERPVYGSKRLGSYTRAMQLVGEQTITNYPYTQPMQAPLKHYELTDHLGNVATVVTGRLLPMIGLGTQYQAEVVSAGLHEPFGLELTGMNWQSDVSRFGFQNQIKDLELNSIHFKYREYSPSDGVFTTIDPLWAKYPFYSPYSFSGNRVIDSWEVEGLEPNPMNYMASGFQMYFRAIGRGIDKIGGTISAWLSVTTSEVTGTNANIHSTTKFEGTVGTNFENFFTPPSDNRTIASPFVVKFTQTQSVDVKVSGKVPTPIGAVNVENTTSQNSNTGVVENTTEGSLKIAGVSLYGSTSVDDHGKTTVETGAKVEVTTPKVKGVSFTIGAKASISPDLTEDGN